MSGARVNPRIAASIPTQAAIRALFAGGGGVAAPGIGLARGAARPTDRELARWVVTLALARDGWSNALGRAEIIVPGGMLKMDTGYCDGPQLAALAVAISVISERASPAIDGPGVGWSFARAATAFGAPWELVSTNRALVHAVLVDSPPAALVDGMAGISRDAAAWAARIDAH